jgi:4-aminobutyrate aminotransferase/(S)-3-amino-2-methylpropionate transaminase
MNDQLIVKDRTVALNRLREQYVPRVYTQHHPIIAVRGEGAWIEDSEGRRYLDFAGGIGVLNVGQRHPKVVEALHEQVDQLLHSGPVMLHDGYITLAARIAEKVAPGGDRQVLFLNSGAEAVENAVKIARHATGRPAIIAFDGSFHGRTLLTSTLNGKVGPYKTQPGSMAPEIHHAAYPNTYRPPAGVPVEGLMEHCLASLDRTVEVETPPEKVAAVIVEPLQGEGGYVVPPPGFLAGVRRFCERIGALLIIDEIQTGYGRTGRMFAYEWEQVEPDILVVGKSLAGGLPLTAVVAPRSIFERVVLGDVGGTYGGNPVACAAALAVLDVFDREGILDEAEAKGTRVRAALEDLASRIPQVGDVRGIGTMLAVEFVADRTTKAPVGKLVENIVASAREKGVITIKAGPYGTVIRLLVPLVATTDELETGMGMFSAAVGEACSRA